MPPIKANGTFTKMSRALLTELNALNNKTKMRKTLTGTMMRRRAMARCWFSNSPPQVTK